MPFLGYIHAEEPDSGHGRRAWQPNWAVWRWVMPAVFIGYGTAHTDGALTVLLVFVVFALACRALLEVLPDGDGMREYRQ
jgi:hypothetical protein